MKLGIVVCKSRGFWGRIISFFTGDYWNHVCIYALGYVYEIRPKQGLIKLRRIDFLQAYADHIAYEVPLDPFKAQKWLESSLNVQYDYKRSISWIFRKFFSLDDSERWNCVEHAQHFASAMGIEFLASIGNISPKRVGVLCETANLNSSRI